MVSQLFFLILLPGLDPPSNITKLDSTPVSFVIQWSSYTGTATLLSYQVLVLREGDVKKNITVAPNTTSVTIKELAVLTEYCVQIRLIATRAVGNLSDCFFVSTDEFNGKIWCLGMVYLDSARGRCKTQTADCGLQTGTGVRVKYRLKVKSIMHTGNNKETADYILFKYILYYCHY